jgi:hypothetical protein
LKWNPFYLGKSSFSKLLNYLGFIYICLLHFHAACTLFCIDCVLLDFIL